MQKLNFIQSDDENTDFHGFPLEEGRFHLLVIGWYSTSSTYVAIDSNDRYAPILDAFYKLVALDHNCGVHYAIFRGSTEILRENVDEFGVDLPWDLFDYDESDIGGPNDINPFTRGTNAEFHV